MISQCSECIYWLPEENARPFGQCRRLAPSPEVSGKVGAFVGPYNWRTIWPYTRDVDGCGDGREAIKTRIKEQKEDQIVSKEQMKDQTIEFDTLVKNARSK